MFLLSRHAFCIASMDAPLLPNDFTTEIPRAYSSTAPARFLPASASAGACFTLCFDTRSRHRNDANAPASAIRDTTGLKNSRNRKIHKKFR